MARPHQPSGRKGGAQHELADDPGERNDPNKSESGFDIHTWQTINQIFERLGKLDAKLDHLDAGQKEIKTTVDGHEGLIKKVIWGSAGAVALCTIGFGIYDRFFSEYVFMKPPPTVEKSKNP